MAATSVGRAEKSTRLRRIAPPGKRMLAAAIIYWIWFLYYVTPSPSMCFVLCAFSGGVAIAVVWFIWLAGWFFFSIGYRRRGGWLSIFIAFAPGLAACMAWMLVHFDAPLKWSVNWNKSRLDALASQVIAGSEGAERPDQIIGGYSLRHIRKESGGFVCVIQSGFVKDWGFAYFSPPAGPPANLFCTPLGNGWYYWKE